MNSKLRQKYNDKGFCIVCGAIDAPTASDTMSRSRHEVPEQRGSAEDGAGTEVLPRVPRHIWVLSSRKLQHSGHGSISLWALT